MTPSVSDIPAAATEPSLLRRSLWVLPTAAAGVLTVLIMGVLPADRTIDNLGEWVFRISPVVFAVVAAALFPSRPGRNLVLLALIVLGYMGVMDTFVIMRILTFAGAADQDAAFPRLYQMTLLLDAFVIIAITFAYRMGGAKTGSVLRVGLAGILILISGLNDLTFYYVYSWPDGRPARLDWASHIRVFIGGGSPTPTIAIIFCAVHLLIAGALIVGPWVLRRRRGAQATADSHSAAASASSAASVGSAAPSGSASSSVTGAG